MIPALATLGPFPVVKAIFGLGGGLIGLILTLAVFGLIAVWIALIVFTYNDARKRIADPFLIGCATAASLFPFVGTLVYTILRPPEFLDDVKEREWDVRATQAQLRRVRATSCRKCGYPAEPDFLRCPSCRSRLREPCFACERPVGLGWKVCPYCEQTLVEVKSKSERLEKNKASRSESSRKEARGSSGKEGREERPSRAEAMSRQISGRDQSEGRPVRPRGQRSGRGEKPINAGEDPGDGET